VSDVYEIWMWVWYVFSPGWMLLRMFFKENDSRIGKTLLSWDTGQLSMLQAHVCASQKNHPEPPWSCLNPPSPSIHAVIRVIGGCGVSEEVHTENHRENQPINPWHLLQVLDAFPMSFLQASRPYRPRVTIDAKLCKLMQMLWSQPMLTGALLFCLVYILHRHVADG